MTKIITQQEAIALRRRIKQLEAHLESQRNRWSGDWPGGSCTMVGRIDVDQKTLGIVETAKKLRHAIVISVDKESIVLWADPLPSSREL